MEDQGSIRPAVAIVSNSQTPYRLHLHRRIALEVPEIELWSVFTHEVSNSPWQIASPDEIQPVFFGQGERSDEQAKVRNQLGEWKKAGRILNWMRERRVQAVVLLGYNDLGRLRIIESCHRKKLPCILFGDSNILAERLVGWKLALKRTIVSSVVRRCAAVLYCGRLGAEYFQQYGAEPKAMFPFPYEPDYALFEDVPASAIEQARERFAISSASRYIVYSGRLVPAKRVDLLLQAFAGIASLRPSWTLLIAGDGPLRSSLEGAMPEALRGRAVWTGFIGDQGVLAALYKCSDVLVLPSDFEPWGVVVTEAATGLALICSSVVGAAADLVHDGVNGRVFAAGNADQLAQALLEVTAEPRVDQMKSASRGVLAEWRRRADPVEGLRAALRFVGVLPEKRFLIPQTKDPWRV